MIKAPHIVGQRHGVLQVILQVFIIMLYENVFQNPELFPTQVSLSPEHSTLDRRDFWQTRTNYWGGFICKHWSCIIIKKEIPRRGLRVCNFGQQWYRVSHNVQKEDRVS
jgi:hypothetical protein